MKMHENHGLARTPLPEREEDIPEKLKTPHRLGTVIECKYCKARLFPEEIAEGTQTPCCENGRINVPLPDSLPAELEYLLAQQKNQRFQVFH